MCITHVRAETRTRLLEHTWNQWQPINCEKQLGGFSDYNVGINDSKYGTNRVLYASIYTPNICQPYIILYVFILNF